MSRYLVYAIAGAILFGIGAYGLVVRRHLLHKVIAGNLMGSGTFLILISLAGRTPAVRSPTPFRQAMVLHGDSRHRRSNGSRTRLDQALLLRDRTHHPRA